MMMPNRSYSAVSGYRYGFNGKENDNEVKGEGNEVNFGARIYDSRLARWLSTDPLQRKYANQSPYNFTVNNPINLIDYNGLDTIRFVRETYSSAQRGTRLDGVIIPPASKTFNSVTVLKAPGPDVFYYDTYTSYLNANGNLYENRTSTEFFPNAKGGDSYSSGITTTNMGLVGNVNDDDRRTLIKLAPDPLIQYLEGKDPEQYKGLSTGKAYLALEKGVKNAFSVVSTIALLTVGNPSSIKALSSTEQRIAAIYSGAEFGTEKIGGFEVLASTVNNGSTFQKNIVVLLSNKRQNIFSLIRSLETQAIEAGASKIEINGLLIQNEKLFNQEAIKRLGYSYERLDNSTISISKTLSKQ